jgi:hypothetical protein
MKRLRLGCIRVRWGSPWIGHVVGAANPVVDRWLVLFDPQTDVGTEIEVRQVVRAQSADRAAFQYARPWRSNPASLQGMLVAAEEFAASMGREIELLVYPDEDEILPPSLGEDVAELNDDCRYLMFSYLLTWGDVDHVRPVYDYMWAPHCKAVFWRAGMKFTPAYPGCCRPVGATLTNSRYSRFPLRHTCFTDEALRARRDRERGRLRPWVYDEVGPPIPYDPTMTWREFRAQSSERATVVVH